MIVTQAIIDKGINGGWSANQLRCLGITDDLFKKGWKSKLVGTEVAKLNIDRFLSLKDAHLKS